LESHPKPQVLKKPRHLSPRVERKRRSLTTKPSLKIGPSSSDAEVIEAVSDFHLRLIF